MRPSGTRQESDGYSGLSAYNWSHSSAAAISADTFFLERTLSFWSRPQGPPRARPAAGEQKQLMQSKPAATIILSTPSPGTQEVPLLAAAEPEAAPLGQLPGGACPGTADEDRKYVYSMVVYVFKTPEFFGLKALEESHGSEKNWESQIWTHIS